MASDISDLTSERYSLKYFLQNKVCRFCWRCNAVTEIPTIKSENTSLSDKIKYCLDISITPKALTNKVCGVCLNKINEFYKFKTFCQDINRKSEIYYEEYLKTSHKDALKGEEQGNTESNALINIKVEADSPHELNIKLEKSPIDDDQDSDHVFVDIKSEKKTLTKVSKIRKKVKLPPRAPTYCNTCHTNLNTLEEFKEHQSKLHGIRDGKYICFGCSKEYTSRKSRESHEIHSCKELKKGFKCSDCNLYLPRRGIYELHTKQHRLKKDIELPKNFFKCKQCVRCFRSKEKLNQHEVLHTIKKEYVCEHCGRVFTKKALLTTHMLRHTGVKEKKCPYCDYRTYQQWGLNLHMRKHNGERPFSCDQCPQRCTTTSNLKVHKMRHAGIKQFLCTVCGKSFVNKGYLKEHTAEVHTTNCSCTCDICGITYRRRRALRRHMNAKHPGCYEYDKSKLAYRIRNDGDIENLEDDAKGEVHHENDIEDEEHLEDNEMENEVQMDDYMIVVIGEEGNMVDEP